MSGSATPQLALSIAYWLHMLATVTWIGGLAALAVVVLPAARNALEGEPKAYALLLESLQRRLDPLGWFSLVMLAATGLVQMSANPNYEGFLSIKNAWSTAIFIKHLFFLVMIGVSAFLSWGLLPKLRRAVLRLSQTQDMAAIEHLRRQETRLVRLNLALGVVILALTALARVS